MTRHFRLLNNLLGLASQATLADRGKEVYSFRQTEKAAVGRALLPDLPASISQNLPNKGDNTLNIINILHAFYGDFDFVEEPWNQDYEGLLLTTGEGRKYIRCRLAKKTPKKEGYFTAFWKKDRNNKNIPYADEDLGDELAIAVIDGGNSGLFIIPKAAAVNKKILSTKDGKGKMAMRFYPPWCTNLNKTAQSAQKWQLEYFQSHNIAD